MLKKGILNPHILNLLARIRHTNTLVIADRGFPFWPTIETVDLSLIDGIPTVLQVLSAIRDNFTIGGVHMASQFRDANSGPTILTFEHALEGVPLTYEDHEMVFKKRVPGAIGLIRTGDTTPYGNMILVSA